MDLSEATYNDGLRAIHAVRSRVMNKSAKINELPTPPPAPPIAPVAPPAPPAVTPPPKVDNPSDTGGIGPSLTNAAVAAGLMSLLGAGGGALASYQEEDPEERQTGKKALTGALLGALAGGTGSLFYDSLRSGKNESIDKANTQADNVQRYATKGSVLPNVAPAHSLKDKAMLAVAGPGFTWGDLGLHAGVTIPNLIPTRAETLRTILRPDATGQVSPLGSQLNTVKNLRTDVARTGTHGARLKDWAARKIPAGLPLSAERNAWKSLQKPLPAFTPTAPTAPGHAANINRINKIQDLSTFRQSLTNPTAGVKGAPTLPPNALRDIKGSLPGYKRGLGRSVLANVLLELLQQYMRPRP